MLYRIDKKPDWYVFLNIYETYTIIINLVVSLIDGVDKEEVGRAGWEEENEEEEADVDKNGYEKAGVGSSVFLIVQSWTLRLFYWYYLYFFAICSHW